MFLRQIRKQYVILQVLAFLNSEYKICLKTVPSDLCLDDNGGRWQKKHYCTAEKEAFVGTKYRQLYLHTIYLCLGE